VAVDSENKIYCSSHAWIYNADVNGSQQGRSCFSPAHWSNQLPVYAELLAASLLLSRCLNAAVVSVKHWRRHHGDRRTSASKLQPHHVWEPMQIGNDLFPADFDDHSFWTVTLSHVMTLFSTNDVVVLTLISSGIASSLAICIHQHTTSTITTGT